jgi:hypothetical protein
MEWYTSVEFKLIDWLWWSTDVKNWDIGGRKFENVGVGWATVCVGTVVVVVHGAGNVGQISLIFAKSNSYGTRLSQKVNLT